MIKYLRENNISLNKVHCIIGSMFGSMDNIPFTRRSLRTICAQITRGQRDHDIKKTLKLFRHMRSEDPGFQCSVDLDEKDQIKTYRDWGGHQVDAEATIAALVMLWHLTLLTTQIYTRCLFVGVNNHFQSTIFAGVLMRNETAESFEWVFREFLTLMGGVHPQTILTSNSRIKKCFWKEHDKLSNRTIFTSPQKIWQYDYLFQTNAEPWR
jgi:hypothetical protein